VYDKHYRTANPASLQTAPLCFGHGLDLSESHPLTLSLEASWMSDLVLSADAHHFYDCRGWTSTHRQLALSLNLEKVVKAVDEVAETAVALLLLLLLLSPVS